MGAMQTYKAVVKKGRLVIADKVNEPDGTVVELRRVTGEAAADPYAYLDEGPDNLDEEQQAALDAAIERGLEQMRQGLGRPVEEVITEMRRHRR